MADTSQPTVFDYATGTQWRLTFNRLPKTTWFCVAANIPGIQLGEAQYPTPLHDLYLIGDKLTFENLTITFIVDEELQNYRELWDWLVGIGSPKQHSQWSTALTKGDGAVRTFGTPDIDPRTKTTSEESNLYSDSTLIVYNSKKIVSLCYNIKFKRVSKW